MIVKVLIAIITCRRPHGLSRLLQSLQQQHLTEVQAEILVVDNACQPEIEALVLSLSANSPMPIHYQQEPEAGIVAARNCCTQWFLKGNYQALAFIDDDEWPAADDWLQKLVQAQHKYQADIVTSHVISVGEAGTPNWALQLLYGKNRLTEGQIINTFYTNNLLISRAVLVKIQPAFDSRFAMTGASDYHFSLRCSRAGFKAAYTQAPVIEEFPKSRANVRWFLRRGFRSGIGYTRSHFFEEKPAIALLRCLMMCTVRIGRGFIKLLVGMITLDRIRCTDGLFRFASAAGTVAGLFGKELHEYRTIHGK